MALKLRPLDEQVIVVTGATSGIGLATVRLATEKGARVFLIGKKEEELQNIQDEMRSKGLQTAFAVADVQEVDQLDVAASQCVGTFGRIDTWINNTGVSVYGKLLETSEEEAHRLFDANFWGVVNGCKVAIPYLREEGGALINIGSVLSKKTFPVQGLYSAAKYAVKGYTDALRRELMAEHAPISVSLVMPRAINVPTTAPVYDAIPVAKFILKCAEEPIRETGVGASSYLLPVLDRFFPKLQDRITEPGFENDIVSRSWLRTAFKKVRHV